VAVNPPAGGLNMTKWPKTPFLSGLIYQLRKNFKGKRIVIIADNVSYHRSRRVERNIKKRDDIKILFLPTYSPEYLVEMSST